VNVQRTETFDYQKNRLPVIEWYQPFNNQTSYKKWYQPFKYWTFLSGFEWLKQDGTHPFVNGKQLQIFE
jgi:hypothetical protein